MKSWFDKRSRLKSFDMGDKELLLLPQPGQSLVACFQGPYTIIRRVRDLNYHVLTPNKQRGQKVGHINMLKPYFNRDSPRYSECASLYDQTSSRSCVWWGQSSYGCPGDLTEPWTGNGRQNSCTWWGSNKCIYLPCCQNTQRISEAHLDRPR